MSVPLYHCAFLFVSILALVSAVPSPAELAPRACTTHAFDTVGRLDKNAPDSNGIGGTFALHRDGGPGSNTVRSVITFPYIPDGATGCMLEITIPKLPTRQNPGPIASGTATQSDVWLIRNPPRDDPSDFGYIYEYTWNNPPDRDQFVSTTIFPTESPTDAPYKTFLWSGTCKRTMSFEFVLSDWQQGSGDVEFYNIIGGKEGLTSIGFHIVHSC